MVENFLESLGKKVHDNGFNIIPLPPKEKAPFNRETKTGFKGWQKLESTHTQIDNWVKLGNKGVGVLTKNTPAVDVDVYDEEISEMCHKWCFENIGKTATRIGKEPKKMLIYRTDQPFKKIKSRIFIDMFENENAVEILGDGQQFVAFNIHPDTNKAYKWVGKSIADCDIKKLPVITPEQAYSLIKYFESIVPKEWIEKREYLKMLKAGESKDPDFDDDLEDPEEFGSDIQGDLSEFDGAKSTVKNVQEKDIVESLKFIDVDDYEEWTKAGMALHHQFKGGPEGLQIWDEWSATSEKYVDGACERKWSSFGDTNSQNPVTIRSIQHTAKERKYESLYEEYLDRYIYVESTDEVCDRKKPKHDNLIKLNQFKNSKANEFIFEEDQNGKPKKVQLATKWLQDPKRKTAAGLRFSPGENFIIKEKGFRYINNFYFPDHEKIEGTDRLDVFSEHIEYIFPSMKERKWFLQWMAFKIQRPADRCKVTPLHYAQEHGTGRGWIVELMEELLGHWNCTRTKMKTLAGEGNDGNYHNFFDKSLLCSIEEVKEGEKRFSVSDRIRDYLDAKRLNLNLKFGANYTADIYTNFFFMTNHSDALVIPEDDRRINVFTGPKDLHGPQYYDRLYEWAKDKKNVAQLFWYLKGLDISDFDFRRCFKTPARTNMIESNKTPTESLFDDFLESQLENKKFAFSFDEIMEKMLGDSEDAFDEETNINQNQLRMILKSRGFVSNKIKIKGKTKRLWLRQKDGLSNDEIRRIRGDN